MGEIYLSRTDDELLRLIGNSDQAAFQVIFNRYYPNLCRFISIYIKDYNRAEELVADLFIRLWDRRTELRIQLLRQYLYVAARHIALNELQKAKMPFNYGVDEQLMHTITDLHPSPHDLMASRESYGEIFSLIDRLPLRQREVLLMSRIEQFDKKQISELLDISVRTVETLLYQAIKSFRVLFTNGDQRSKI